MSNARFEFRDNMQVAWDVPIEMDDGIVLRADVFRPVEGGRCPVILSYGPYAKGLSFQEGYKGNWARLTAAAPEVDRKSTRLNSSHMSISYAVFCLKKKKNIQKSITHL